MNRFLMLSVASATAATLLFELALTRLLSVTTWYHFAFAVISAALLGIGSGASLVAVSPRWFPAGAERVRMAIACAIGSLLCAVAVFTVLAAPQVFTRSVTVLLVDAIAAVMVFAVTGVVMALALRCAGGAAPLVYGADLLGAASGALLFVPTASGLGAPGAALGAGLLFALAGFIVAGPGRARSGNLLAAAAVMAALVMSQTTDVARVRRGAKLPREMSVNEAYWNAYSFVTVSEPGYNFPFGWGFGRLPATGPPPRQLAVAIDLMAETVLTEFSGDLDNVDYLRYDVTGIVYALAPRARVMVIGVGGGRDVLTALCSGARHVTGVDVNGIILGLITGRHRQLAGLADRADVRLVHDEARSFLARSEQKFDVIQASLVDTWAASASGAFALSENSLYTVEAWSLFLDRLTDDGFVTVSRWHRATTPELVRSVTLAVEALARRGVEEPQRHIAVVRGSRVGTILVKRSPFDDVDNDRILTECSKRGFEPLFVPGRVARAEFAPLAGGVAEWREMVAAHPIWDLRAPPDDRPFFFYLTRPGDWLRPGRLAGVSGAPGALRTVHTDPLHVLLTVLMVAVVAAAVLLVVPALVVARRQATAAPRTVALLYMAAIGLAYMSVEVPLLTRLAIVLGHPVLSLVVVLAGLLVASGCGSLMCAFLAPRGRATVIGILPLLVVAMAFGLDAMAPSIAALPQAARIAAAALLVFSVGLPMGMPLPTGLLCAARRDGRAAPLLFGVNGAFSVLGSVLAMIALLTLGVRATLLAGAVLYGLAALLLRSMVSSRHALEVRDDDPADDMDQLHTAQHHC